MFIGNHYAKGFIKHVPSTEIHLKENLNVDLSLPFGCTLKIEDNNLGAIKFRTILGNFDIKASLSSILQGQNFHFSVKVNQLKIKELKVFKSSNEVLVESSSLKALLEKNTLISEHLFNTALLSNTIHKKNNDCFGVNIISSKIETQSGYLKLSFDIVASQAPFVCYFPDIDDLTPLEQVEYTDQLYKYLISSIDNNKKSDDSNYDIKEDL